jgi:hypothetical protein
MIEWQPKWYGLIATDDGWEVTIRCVDGVHIWEAECFGCSGWGDADTEGEAKSAALTWVADTLREVPPRAAVALGALTGKAPAIPSQVLTEHIERHEAMRAQISEAPDADPGRTPVSPCALCAWLWGA